MSDTEWSIVESLAQTDHPGEALLIIVLHKHFPVGVALNQEADVCYQQKHDE